MSKKSKSAKRELFPAKTGSSNSETESNGNETDSSSEIEAPTEDSDSDALLREFGSLQIEEEKKDGEWLKNHIWKEEKPDSTLKMEATVKNSDTYPTPRKWRKNGDNLVDLAEIYSNLPSFVEDVMKGGINSCRQELERVLQTPPSKPAFDTPHMLEIESLPSKDRKVSQKGKYAAASLISPPEDPAVENFYYFDCEHMLKMYVPGRKSSWFQTQTNRHTRWIRKIKSNNYMGKRWVFIPSFRRAQIALLQWPHDEFMNDDSTIRILVVRPSEFDAYVRYCGPHFPVIRLPQDEIGAGYARYWIQKIALRLELQFIWMIDDSIKYFFEYDPSKRPPRGSYKEFRTRKFGLVFKRIEKFVEEGEEVPIVAMSPKRFLGCGKPLKQPFVCKPPQCAVYLNLRKLQEKHVCYRPELKTLEDMIFGYECEQHGLKVFRDNSIHLYDQPWNDTGASSPSVKTNTQSSSSVNKQTPERSSSVDKQTPQRSSSANRQTTQRSSSVNKQTAQRSSSANKQTPERSSSVDKQTPERSSSVDKQPAQRSSSVNKQTAQSSSSANKQTPERSSSVNKQTPERSPSVNKQTTQRSSSVNKQTTQRSSSANKQTPERSSSVNKQTPERSPSVNKQTTQRSSSVNKQTTQRSSSANKQTPERSSSVNKQTPERSPSVNKQTTQSSSSVNKQTTQRSSSVNKQTAQRSLSANKQTPERSSSVDKQTARSSSSVKNSRSHNS